jgi:hypothetical protein
MTVSMRLALTVLCIVGLAAAETCPSAASTSDDYFASDKLVGSCDAFLSCATTACTCYGGTFDNKTVVCSNGNSSSISCATKITCQKTYISCVQSAAATKGCKSNLQIAIVNVYATGVYTSSNVEKACQSASCNSLLNNGNNCNFTYSDICFLNGVGTNTLSPSVAKFLAKIVFAGDFTLIINVLTNYLKFVEAFNTDATIKFEVQCNVTSITSGSGVVLFTANAASGDAAFAAKLAAAASSTTWLTNTQDAFTAAGGGSLSILSIGAASGSSYTLYAWSALAAVLLALFA